MNRVWAYLMRGRERKGEDISVQKGSSNMLIELYRWTTNLLEYSVWLFQHVGLQRWKYEGSLKFPTDHLSVLVLLSTYRRILQTSINLK